MKQKFDDATLRMSVVDDATAQECWGGVGWCPRMVCVAHFDFEMCFAPQRRALFRHLNFQKWSENGCALYILTSKCAPRHNGVQFFISHLASWLCTRRFRSLLFDPPEPQITGKIQCFATFLPFRVPASSFFWPFLFSDLLSSALLSSTLLFSLTLPISAFHLSILSAVWLLNFLRPYLCIDIDICIYTQDGGFAIASKWLVEVPKGSKERSTKNLLEVPGGS